jgi:ribosomal protein S6--L-glutamate ligase
VQIAILGRPDGWYAQDLRRAARDRGHSVVVAPFEALSAHVGMTANAAVLTRRGEEAFELSACDALLVRTMPPGSLEQVVFRMDALHAAAARGVQIVNPPRAVECAVDKYLTTQRLAACGLPVPSTVVCEDADDALAAFADLGGDVVVKPLFGSEGRGIVRVSDPDLALRTFRTLARTQQVLYLQRFIPHAGFDLRVLVLDGRVLAAMRRSSDTDFRTNVARQARAAAAQPNEVECRWAVAAAEATGARIAGVDLLYDRNGRGYVIEVNAVPGWKALQRVTGCDVAAALIRSLEQAP